MQISSTGGIFLRLDASGNLNIYNTSGTTIAKFVGSSFSTSLNVNQGGLPSATTTTSTNPVSTGMGVSITPQVDTQVLVWAGITGGSNTAAVPVTFFLYRNTTGIPAAGTSVGADPVVNGTGAVIQAAAAGQEVGIAMSQLNASLTVGTQYFYYVAYKTSNASDAARISFGVMQALEI